MKSIQLAAAAGVPEPGYGPGPLMHINGHITHGTTGQFPRSTDQAANAENAMPSGVLPLDEKALSGLQARMERLKSGSIEPL